MIEPTTIEDREEGREERHCAVLGVIVAPGLAHDVTSRIASELLDDVRERYDSVDWRTELQVDRLVVPPAPLTEVLDAGRRKLLEGDWDLGVIVTDLPLKVGGRPVSRHVSPTHGLAVLSLPALGPLHLRQRLRRALVELIGELTGGRSSDAWEDSVLRELTTDTARRPGGLGLLYAPALVASHLRLLLGMVRANRPWRLAARLYGALVAALAVGAYSVVTSDVWRLAGSTGWWRLLIICVVSVTGTVAAIIGAHGLWERAPDPRVRGQVALFNVTTTLTVATGILCLYLVLFALILGVAELLIGPDVFASALGHPAVTTDYLALAWFSSSFATVAGGLGAGLDRARSCARPLIRAPWATRRHLRTPARGRASLGRRIDRPAQPPLDLLHPGLAPAGDSAPGARRYMRSASGDIPAHWPTQWRRLMSGPQRERTLALASGAFGGRLIGFFARFAFLLGAAFDLSQDGHDSGWV